MSTTGSAGTGASTTSTAAMPSTATRSSPAPRVPAAATNVSSAGAAAAIMADHYTVSACTDRGVTYKVLRMVIEANCRHIFRGCGVLCRQYATRHHRLDQPAFNQGLRDR